MRIANASPYRYALHPLRAQTIFPQQITVGLCLYVIVTELEGSKVIAYQDPVLDDDNVSLVVFEIRTDYSSRLIYGEPLGRFILTKAELAQLCNPDTQDAILAQMKALMTAQG